MEPSSKHLGIAFLCTVLPEDLNVAQMCLPSLLSQLTSQDHLFLLVNGVPSGPLPDLSGYGPPVSLIESQRNLGIANGRNKLLEESIACGYEWFHIFDADLLSPSGYRDSLATTLSNQDPSIGVSAPLLLNAQKFTNHFQERQGVYHVSSTQDLKKSLEEALSEDPEARQPWVYHAGVRDWPKHYLDHREGTHWYHVDTWLARNHSFLRRNLNSLGWAVDCIPGGVHLFNREFLDRNGPYSEYFNPYGYEDVEFCIRSLKNNAQNFLMAGSPLLHDPRTIAHAQNKRRMIERFLLRA